MTMKQFLTGVAAIAALAMAAPVWAQPAPSTAPPGTSTTAPPAAPVQSMNRMPAGGRATSERGATGSVTRAHHRRHAVQSTRNASSDNTANQLNREELSQLPGANPTTTNRMSVGGKPTSGGPTQ